MRDYYRHSDLDGLSPADRELTRFEERMDYTPLTTRIKRELVCAENDNGNCSAEIDYKLKRCRDWVDEVNALRELIEAIEERHVGAKR